MSAVDRQIYLAALARLHRGEIPVPEYDRAQVARRVAQVTADRPRLVQELRAPVPRSEVPVRGDRA
jgi:hypothetical protein